MQHFTQLKDKATYLDKLDLVHFLTTSKINVLVVGVQKEPHRYRTAMSRARTLVIDQARCNVHFTSGENKKN